MSEQLEQQTAAAAAVAGPVLFDRTRKIEINLARFGKRVTLRFPTDQEQIQYSARLKSYQRVGKNRIESDYEVEAAAELIKAIRVEGDVIEDEAAPVAVRKIMRVEIEETRPEQTPEGFFIPVIVMGGIRTVHYLKSPDTRTESRFDSDVIMLGDRKFGRTPVTFSYSVVDQIYNSLFLGVEGYAESSDVKAAVPVAHKLGALRGLFDSVKNLDDEASPVLFR